LMGLRLAAVKNEKILRKIKRILLYLKEKSNIPRAVIKGANMDRSIENESEQLLVVEEGVVEDLVGQVCICSIFMDVPGKFELLCESTRAALASQGK
jgi:hypothetical protein